MNRKVTKKRWGIRLPLFVRWDPFTLMRTIRWSSMLPMKWERSGHVSWEQRWVMRVILFHPLKLSLPLSATGVPIWGSLDMNCLRGTRRLHLDVIWQIHILKRQYGPVAPRKCRFTIRYGTFLYSRRYRWRVRLPRVPLKRLDIAKLKLCKRTWRYSLSALPRIQRKHPYNLYTTNRLIKIVE